MPDAPAVTAATPTSGGTKCAEARGQTNRPAADAAVARLLATRAEQGLPADRVTDEKVLATVATVLQQARRQAAA